MVNSSALGCLSQRSVPFGAAPAFGIIVESVISRTYAKYRQEGLSIQLDDLRQQPQIRACREILAATGTRGSDTDCRATILCLPRHGHATTRTTIENLYDTVHEPFRLVYLDIASPPPVRSYLAQQARSRKDFIHVRIDSQVSRQTARLTVLDQVSTPYTAFVDNNMLLSDGWLDRLIETSEQENAAIVSPMIVMQGGNVHFSGSGAERLPDGSYRRFQTTEACPATAPLTTVVPERLDIDFAESHCCLMRTATFSGRTEEIFVEATHNAHTVAVASYQLKKYHGERMLIEPAAVASILPIGFGYDVPWLFESYNRLDWLKSSYEVHETVLGRISATQLDSLRWHRRHLLYVLLSMTSDDRLSRDDLLGADEIPAYLDGYDKPIPSGGLEAIDKRVLPWIRQHAPAYLKHAKTWRHNIDGIIEDIDRFDRILRKAS